MIPQLQAFWTELDTRRRLIAALSAVAIVAAVIGMARLAATPSMALLYSGLDAPAAGEVVAALEARGVPFEVRDQAIYVDGAQRDQVRMSLASDGLPAAGAAGYELLDALSGFGTTSQMFDAAYWRAKEGELARTITGSPNVRSARVHLANPVSQPFTRAVSGTASVTVTMARGNLDAGQAEAIRYLVSSAVMGMSPDAVAVIDAARGVVLAGAEGPAGSASNPNDRAESLRANVQRLLEARVGAGRAIVEVSIDTVLDSETISERVIDPQSRVAISSDTEQNTESATGPAPGVTVASNLPDGDVGAGGGDSSRNSSQTRERQNFEVSETRRERVVAPGQVRRISVAVMVDGVSTPGAEGAPPTWEPRPAEELETLRGLVQSAVGFDPARGDTVTIETLQFTAVPEAGSLAERGGADWLAANAGKLAQVGVLGLIVLALIFFVLRPMMQRRPPVALPELSGPLDVQAQIQRALANGMNPNAEDGQVLDAPPSTLTKIDRLREVIAARGDDSAGVLRAWIEAPETRKEPLST